MFSFCGEQHDPSGGYRQYSSNSNSNGYSSYGTSDGSASTYTSAPLGGGQGYGRWASSLGGGGEGVASATGRVINNSSGGGEEARSAARLKEIRARYEKRARREEVFGAHMTGVHFVLKLFFFCFLYFKIKHSLLLAYTHLKRIMHFYLLTFTFPFSILLTALFLSRHPRRVESRNQKMLASTLKGQGTFKDDDDENGGGGSSSPLDRRQRYTLGPDGLPFPVCKNR